MKAFFERYSYESVRLALNQIAISMFGFALAMTAGKAESDALLLWSSIGSIVFYLALTYGTAHKTGSAKPKTPQKFTCCYLHENLLLAKPFAPGIVSFD